MQKRYVILNANCVALAEAHTISYEVSLPPRFSLLCIIESALLRVTALFAKTRNGSSNVDFVQLFTEIDELTLEQLIAFLIPPEKYKY